MTEVKLTLYCAASDADAIAELLKGATERPVHIREELVFGLDFSDASTQEQVTGQLDRRSLDLLVRRDAIDGLIARIAGMKRTAPVRWLLTPVEAEGRLP